MTNTIPEAETHCLNQSLHGPAFPVGTCKTQCRMAYGIPTDGTPDATQSWFRAKDRHPATDPRQAPRGAFNHWVGGSSGHGHITVSRFQGGDDWSSDFEREGFFDSVDPRAIVVKWSLLQYVGWSWDLDGVNVKPVSAPPAPKRPHIRAAVKATQIAIGKRKNDTPRRRHLATALRELLRALGGKK